MVRRSGGASFARARPPTAAASRTVTSAAPLVALRYLDIAFSPYHRRRRKPAANRRGNYRWLQGPGLSVAALHRFAAERAEADGMLQDALAPIFQNGSRDRQHEDTILDEEMPASGKRHRRRHVLAAMIFLGRTIVLLLRRWTSCNPGVLHSPGLRGGL